MNEQVKKAGAEFKRKAGLEGVQCEAVYNPSGYPADYPKNDNGPKNGKPKTFRELDPVMMKGETGSKSDRLS